MFLARRARENGHYYVLGTQGAWKIWNCQLMAKAKTPMSVIVHLVLEKQAKGLGFMNKA